MAVDRYGNTIVAGDEVALVGTIRDITGTDALVALAGGKHALRATTTDVFNPDAIPSAVPVDIDFTFNAAQQVTLIDFDTGARTLTFTWNADGSVNTIVDTAPAHTKTFAYNADGSVDTITIS